MSKGSTTGDAPAYADFIYTASDGLRLHVRDYGHGNELADPHAMAVVCLPGLTRTARDFHRFAIRLSNDNDCPRRVVVFEYRGRGQSERDTKRAAYTIATETGDILDGLAALGIAEAAFVGTSRGALIIHMLAAMRPGIMTAAVLNDAGPVIEGTGLARIKMHLERMPAPENREQASDFLKQAYGRAFPVLTEEDWQEMADAIFRDGKGERLAADYDPAILAQLKKVDFNTPLPTLWPQFDGLRAIPLMTVRGENSTLLSQATVEEMLRRRPDMTVLMAEGQGHPPLLHIGGIDTAIADFLKAHDRP